MKKLILIRPEPGASASVDRAAALGLAAVAMPLFELRAVAWEAPDPLAYDALLVTSASAMRLGGDGLTQLRGLRVVAVGTATASAARAAGFEVAIAGAGGVDTVLSDIPADARLLHLSGRDFVESGRPMDRITVYESVSLPPPDADMFAGSVVALHSPRAADAFAATVRRRASVAVVALSDAVAAKAGHGWLRLVIAAVPTDAALLALAAELCLENGE